MRSFLTYYKEMILNPGTAFKGLIKDPEHSRHTFKGILLLAILFIVPNSVMILIEAVTPVPPVVILPPEYFYHWITFVGIPAQIPLFIMTAGIITLLCAKSPSSPGFTEVFSMTVYSLSFPFFFYALFEIVYALWLIATGTREITPVFLVIMVASMVLTLVGHLYYLTQGIHQIFMVKKGRSFTTAVTATLIFWFFACFFFA